MFRRTTISTISIHMIERRRTVRSLKNLLTLAKRARSFTDNSGRRYSSITSVGTSSRPVWVGSADMVDIVSRLVKGLKEPSLNDVNEG
jgi:hypothetical protein